MSEEDHGKINLNEAGRQKAETQNSLQRTKHAKLHFDQLDAQDANSQKTDPLTAPDSPQTDRLTDPNSSEFPMERAFDNSRY